MNDNDLGFDGAEARARNTDPDTSHTAAEEVSPHVRELQLKVLAYAHERGDTGFMDPEMNEWFDTHSSTYRTRRSELVALGMIADTGERVALGGRGRKHAIWRITDAGRAKHFSAASSGLKAAA